MSWVGLRDKVDGVYATAGLGHASRAPVDLNGILPSGTLMLHFATSPKRKAQEVLHFHASSPWESGLSVVLGVDGTLCLTQWQGDQKRCFELKTGLVSRAQGVTLTYVWDAPARKAVMSVEIADTATHIWAEMADPLPLPLRDAVRMMADHGHCRTSDGLHFAAVADTVMPIGPLPTMVPNTKIETPRGLTSVASLKVGQRVFAADGRKAQIRAIVSAVLPARARFAPLQMRAPYHGLRHDIALAPEQRLRQNGSEVEYLFGTEAISVHAEHLHDGMTALPIKCGLTQTYYQILLDRQISLNVGGLAFESFDAALLVADPALRAHSVLTGLPQELMPKQVNEGAPVLLGFEALTLNALRGGAEFIPRMAQVH